MKRLFFALALLSACSSQQPTPTPPVPHDETVTQVTPSWYHPPRAIRAELKPDTRSPEEITAAACRGPNGQWFCRSPQPRASSATAVGPIIPPSWTVPQWYVDPSNSSGTASDNNNCTTTSTPCLTWHEINDHRWGCIGSPNACPRLRQNTNITFLSSHTNDSDPVYFLPAIEHSAFVTLQGAAPTLVATVSLSGVTAKSTVAGANSLLIANIGGSGVANMLLENTTHPSRAWTYMSLGGGSFSITQPMMKLTTPFSLISPAEVNTWSNTDSVKLLTPVAINLISAIPEYADSDLATQTNVLNLYQFNVLNPLGTASYVMFGTFSAIGEVLVSRVANVSGGFDSNVNVFSSFNSILGPASINSYSAFFSFGGSISGTVGSVGSATVLDEDIIITGGGWRQYGGIVDLSRVYIDSNIFTYAGGISVGAEFFSPAAIYGSASHNMNLNQASHLSLAGTTFTNAFTAPALITGILLNNSATACSSTGGATPTIACGISTTPAHLDAAAGAAGFGGIAFNLGGASINSAP